MKKRRALSRNVLALSVVAVLTAACGASGTPTAAPGAAAQTARGHRRAGYASLYSFTGSPDGAQPTGGLIVDGQFYGTTQLGGETKKCHDGCGTVFRISSDGQERVVYRFKGPPDGKYPQAGLTELSGELYGTTYYGGTGSCPGGCGVVF